MAKSLPLSKWKEPLTCDCKTCRKMCQVPCFPSPDEARKLMRLGYGKQMMINSRTAWYRGRAVEVAVLSPARKDTEQRANYEGNKGCTLQVRGKCAIHTICKPIEGRLADCQNRDDNMPMQLRDKVVQLWDNDAARRLVKYWIKKYAHEAETLLYVFRPELTLRDSKAKSRHEKTSNASSSTGKPRSRTRTSSR